MRIFFAGSIRGGRQLRPLYREIICLLSDMGHEIVSEHVASETLLEAEAKMSDREIFESDIRFIDECECMVAEVTMPSTGVGYEICYAVESNKKVVCLYKAGTNVSAMVTGNSRITSIPYAVIEELKDALLHGI
ncbi:MAG TPA: deoxyribonucleoside 5'-monophosphate N-glycosidase [Candidatus Methanoperedenaceae archaeon]|nr:deoxyribonucleoside 5'-monophosphate N-glycosidase [Candidatus Methanoperedenaceae archaeon]